jgi:hypothetical protein
MTCQGSEQEEKFPMKNRLKNPEALQLFKKNFFPF